MRKGKKATATRAMRHHRRMFLIDLAVVVVCGRSLEVAIL